MASFGGVRWDGDPDNEIIFGTSWNDILIGHGGEDTLYGFEGDDMIEGGNLVNRIFGDAGNDIIWTGDSNTLGDVSRSNPEGSANLVSPSNNGDGNFASGGSGNDTMIGTDLIDIMFGGPGHDVI